MEETRFSKLVKRLKADAVCSWMLAAIFVLSAVSYLVRIVVLIQSGNYEGGELENLIPELTRMLCIAVAQILLSAILSEIIKSGRPFLAGNVKKIRAMAVILMASFPLEVLSTMVLGFADSRHNTGIIINFGSLAIMFMGAVVGIISEVFFYGKELEEEIDQIA
jgi:magnesium-transporting ATPase (P-type)